MNLININSEFEKLNDVILHNPGIEIERMTPQNIEKALFSDILNLNIANKEYLLFKKVLSKVSNTYEINNLLKDILKDSDVKHNLIATILDFEKINISINFLLEKNEQELSDILIQGLEDKNYNKILANRYIIKPLYNFYFTRDASVSINNSVLIGNMANFVRQREAIIMDFIFKFHPLFKAKTYNSIFNDNFTDANIEGGDILIARDDILLIGTGLRTSKKGIDFIVDSFKNDTKKRHFIIQELPHSPESFIHLDMVFTLLDNDKCMIYEPVILNPDFDTTHIITENGKVIKTFNEISIISALNNLGFNLSPVYCGGKTDNWLQQREQWHSGANFFAFAPSKIIGYERNTNTINALNNEGFEVIKAKDFISNKKNPDNYKRAVITIESSELVRGGGGARCMTMPVNRG